MLKQPDQFRRLAARDCRCARRHGRERVVVSNQAIAHAPFDRRKPADGKRPMVTSPRVFAVPLMASWLLPGARIPHRGAAAKPDRATLSGRILAVTCAAGRGFHKPPHMRPWRNW